MKSVRLDFTITKSLDNNQVTLTTRWYITHISYILKQPDIIL